MSCLLQKKGALQRGYIGKFLELTKRWCYARIQITCFKGAVQLLLNSNILCINTIKNIFYDVLKLSIKHHYTPNNKKLLKQCIKRGEPTAKKATISFAGKVMITFFLDFREIIFIHYLRRTTDEYFALFLHRLNDTFP